MLFLKIALPQFLKKLELSVSVSVSCNKRLFVSDFFSAPHMNERVTNIAYFWFTFVSFILPCHMMENESQTKLN